MNKYYLFAGVVVLFVLIGAFFVSGDGVDPRVAKMDCSKNIPDGKCDAPATKCVQTAGGACIYRCKVSGSWDDGAQCTTGKCAPSGVSCDVTQAILNLEQNKDFCQIDNRFC